MTRNVETYRDQVAELKMASEAACFARNSFHQATVPKECYPIEVSKESSINNRGALTISIIIDKVETFFVINSP